MAEQLQLAIDSAPEGCERILLAYGLCNNGMLGLKTNGIPLVALRSHDCVACLLGSFDRYLGEHERTPGSYWLSIGWVEEARDASDYISNLPAEPPPDDPKWLELLEKYGDDNARFLWEEERKMLSHYERLVYIDTGVGPQAQAREEAARRSAAMGLRFEEMEGDRSWLDALLNGPWDEERFLTVPPRHIVTPRYDKKIVEAKPCQEPSKC
jgi:hypothetical protein